MDDGPIALRPLRLAIFSPVPPTPSGIAAYLVDLLPLLPAAWGIDVFTDEGVEADVGALARSDAGPVPSYQHGQFHERQTAAPYDLVVYQVGNSSARTWMLDYVLQYPGLLVLHDGVLHPARVDAATAAHDLEGYRVMARACRDDTGAAIGHLVAGGLGGPALYFTYPMCEDLVRASALTAMHGEDSCAWLRRLVPEAQVAPLVHWRSVAVDEVRRERWRRQLAADGSVLIGSFGNIGVERRLHRVLEALAATAAVAPWRLVVAGRVDPHLELPSQAERLGLADRIVWQADLDDADFVALMAATDLAVNLRHPPARASSGVLHQLLQLGVPALISDVVHWREYPDRAVARIPPGPDASEARALEDALRRWIDDAEARAAAGRAARSWAARRLTPAAMRDSYVRAVEMAVTG